MNEEKWKINWEKIDIDPIAFFSTHINKNIEEIVEVYIKEIISSTNIDLKLVLTNQENMKLIQKEIDNEYKKRNIQKITRKIFWMKISCFFLFGLFFLNKIKACKKELMEWEKFREQKVNVNKKYEADIIKEISIVFSTTRILDLIMFVLEKLGINSFDNVPRSILDNRKDIVDIRNGIQGVLKNNPFYDFVYRKLNYKEIETKASKSFPYITTETYKTSNGYSTRFVTKQEIITAYHREKTPIIESYLGMILKTNYDSNVSFTLYKNNETKNKYSQIFENKEFSNLFCLEIDSLLNNNEQKALEIFSIKTQENLVRWIKNNGQFYKMTKTKNNDIVLLSEELNRIKILENLDNPLLDFINISSKETFFTIKQKCINVVKSYFKGFVNMGQVPLLFPFFSREWYQSNGNYLISNFGNKEDQNNEKTWNLHYTINKFLNSNFYHFLMPNKPRTPSYFHEISIEEKENNTYIGTYSMKSFYVTKEIDTVITSGIHRKNVLIDVPYEKYHSMEEIKKIFHLRKNLNFAFDIISNNKMQYVVNPKAYENKEFSSLIKQNFVFCNNPKEFEKHKLSNEIMSIIKEFNLIIKGYEDHFALIINKTGFIITINGEEFLSKNIEEILLNKILNKLNKLVR